MGVKEAAALLGVHEATLRRWTRQGYLQAFRTPGGHRRYLRSAVEALVARAQGPGTEGPWRPLKLVERQALLQARRALQQRLPGEPWRLRYHRREVALRARGRELLGLLVHYLVRETGGSSYLDRARQMLRGYGREAAQLGLSAAETARAFLVFRQAVVEAITRTLHHAPAGDPEGWRLWERAERFFDELLISTLEGHADGGGAQSTAAPPAAPPVGAAPGGGCP